MNKLLYEIIREELCDVVGEDGVDTSEAGRFCYGADYSWVSRAWVDRGMAPPLPDYVVLPHSTEEVSRVLKIANHYKVPVVPYAGGTGVNGGILALYGGIMLDLKRMKRLLRIDEKSLTVTAEAGINGEFLERELNLKGLTLGHYPASGYCATLGGYLAARGSGTLSTKYGKAEERVVAMEGVLPTGEIVRTLPVPRHATGPDFLNFFIGSEGTLGVITEVTMMVDPLPEVRDFQGFLFKSLADGIEAGRRIMTERLRPCVIRLYDPPSTIRFIQKVLGIQVEGSFMVVGCDGKKDMVTLEMKEIGKICKALGGEDRGRKPGETWWEERYKFYFPPFCPDLPELFGTMDSVTTYDRIIPLYEAKKKTIEEGFKDFGARYTAHFSHWFPWGTMIYDRFFVEKPPQDPREAIQLHNRIWAAAIRAALAEGGVVNEHHGIGQKLGYFMPEQLGSAWPVLVSLKKMLDPNNIMNPGKMGL
ncbi:MAG: FAD-binding oxidoreductase [Syntrophaceae bacterium]|nr:FAD-binding oxidoreductase [Syntrophaceae bacterium]